MRWLLFASEQNAISKHCTDILQVAGQAVIVYCHQGKSSVQEITTKLASEKPDRIIIVLDQKKDSSTLVNSITDHLLIPLYVAQATINIYSPIPVLLLSRTTENTDLNIIQDATDQLIDIYPHVLNAKLLTPIDEEEINANHFQSLWKNAPNELHRVALLSDVLPILLATFHDGKAKGHVNICNKGTISLDSFDQIQQSKALTLAIESEDITDKFDQWNKQLISPETRQIYQASFSIPHITKSIEQMLQQKSLQADPNQSKNILVTGGCGFIGSTFINHWLATYPSDQIINIDRLDPVADPNNILQATSPNYSLIVADINNKDIVLHLCHQYNITHVVHFAVQAHLDATFGNSITFTESNVYGTHSVLEAGRIYGKILKFIHISTDEVYGETALGTHQDIGLLNPTNPYAATIAAAEFLVKSYGESFKLPFCIIRLCNVYGPRQHIEKLIPTFIHQLSNGGKLTIQGDGKQLRYYIYVDDVINAIELIFKKGKTKMVYNIGTENELNVLDIARSLLKKLQPKEELEKVLTFVKARSFKEKRYCITTSPLIKSLGWKEQTTFEQGLDKTIQWFQANSK